MHHKGVFTDEIPRDILKIQILSGIDRQLTHAKKKHPYTCVNSRMYLCQFENAFCLLNSTKFLHIFA